MSEPFPLIEISGGPEERGRSYGQQAAARIHKGIGHHTAQLQKLSPDAQMLASLVRDLLSRNCGDITVDMVKIALSDDFATPWSVCRPPRLNLAGNLSATVATIVLRPAQGVMEAAVLPALDPTFTTYRLND